MWKSIYGDPVGTFYGLTPSNQSQNANYSLWEWTWDALTATGTTLTQSGVWSGLTNDGTNLFGLNNSPYSPDYREISQINPSTAASSIIGSLPVGAGDQWYCLAYGQGKFFAIRATTGTLYSLDKATLAATSILQDDVFKTDGGLAYNDSGHVWFVSDDDNTLYRIRVSDGSKTDYGSMGSGNWDALTWVGDTLYALDASSDSDLYRLTLSPITKELVGSVGLNLSGMTFLSG